MALVDSGLMYCTIHHGVVDVDEDDCDFNDDGFDCQLVALVYEDGKDG